jgi:hypothetical protein
MADNNHQPGYIPQIGIPEKESFQEKTTIRAIYHRATAPGFFGVIILCFFMSFINIKCNGKVVASFSGFNIITGKNNGNGSSERYELTASPSSAYYRLQKAKELFEWKKNLKEDYEKYVDEAPYFEPNESGTEDMGKIPEKFEDTTDHPQEARFFTTLAFLAALGGLILAFLNGKWGAFAQIIMSLVGFISMLALQYYIKITMPTTHEGDTIFQNDYSNKMVTTELALGYWVVLFLFLGVTIIGFMKLRYHRRLNALSKQ